MMMGTMGHSSASSWHGVPRGESAVWKGCKQGAPESPALCNILLDEAMAPVLQQSEERGVGAYVATLASDRRNRQPKNWGDKAGCVTHLAFADDIILIAKHVDARRLYRLMGGACDR